MLRCTQPAQIRQSPLTELNVTDVLLNVDAADCSLNYVIRPLMHEIRAKVFPNKVK